MRKSQVPKPPWRIPVGELRFKYTTSSGPGGQNVNRIRSKAILHWSLRESKVFTAAQKEKIAHALRHRFTASGDLVLKSDRMRDQNRNRVECIQRLQRLLVQALVPRLKRRPTEATEQSREKRLMSKQLKSQKKQKRRRPQLPDWDR